MSKLLVVFGATGNQGGSVIQFVLDHPDLSSQYRIRGLTRDISKPASQKLQSLGVEMVNCKIDEQSSIESCLQGVHTIFAMTIGEYNTNTREYEYAQGKAIADAAVKAKAQYIIYSSLPSISKTSHGKLTHAWQFDVKADVEDYMRSLPIQSAFFAPGSFMQNAHTAYKPRKQDDGTYVVPSIEPSDSRHMPLIDIEDTGKYVGAILLKPDEYQGKTLYGSVGLFSWNEMVEAISKATGKTVKHKIMPEAVFRGFMNPVRGNELCDMMNNRSTYGYYGENQEEHINWSNEQAIGKLTTFEEYLEKHPLEI